MKTPVGACDRAPGAAGANSGRQAKASAHRHLRITGITLMRASAHARQDSEDEAWSFSGSVRRDPDDEVSVESCGDALEQGNGRDDAACFEAGHSGLGYYGSCGRLRFGNDPG